MWFDVQAALAEIEGAPGVTTADSPPRVAHVAHVARSPKSISSHVAPLTSPERVAVNTRNSSASLVEMPAPDDFTASIHPADRPRRWAGRL